MGFVALNLLVAPHVQRQPWRELNKQARLPDAPDLPPDLRTQETTTAPGAARFSKQDVVEASKHAVLYDFGVLAHFVVLFLSVGVSYYGSLKIHQEGEDCHDNADGLAPHAAYTGMIFVAFALTYGVAWFSAPRDVICQSTYLVAVLLALQEFWRGVQWHMHSAISRAVGITSHQSGTWRAATAT